MRQETTNHLVLTNAAAAYSVPVPTRGLNGVGVEVTVIGAYVPSSATISVSVEETSDLQNWAAVPVTVTFTGTTADFPAYNSASTGAASTLSGSHVRLKFEAGAASVRATVATQVNFFNFSS